MIPKQKTEICCLKSKINFGDAYEKRTFCDGQTNQTHTKNIKYKSSSAQWIKPIYANK